MSACAMLSYNNFTAAAFECCKGVAAKYGVTINSNSGSGSKDGFTIAWNYNPSLQTLSIQCTDSPWWAPCSMINSKINDAVEGCLQSHQVDLSPMTDG